MGAETGDRPIEAISRGIGGIGQCEAAGAREQQSSETAAIAQLAGGFAHDINNLLAVILGNCEILEDQKGLPEPSRKMILEIHHAGVSARTLGERLLALGRGQVLRPVTLDLNEAIPRMEVMLRGLLGEGIELTISLSGGRGTIDADPSQIEQVLMNLTINARDAMPDGGRIVVETANVEVDETNVQQFPRIRPGHYAMLSVSDTGMGMDEETQSRIFEPFFTTKPPGKGAGLGLSIVSGIAKQCGGAIAVHSEPGAGAAFKVYFPRSDEALKTVPPGKREPGRAEAETILLVDDAADLRKLMRRILEDCGYTVLDSGDPAEAIRLAAERSAPLRLMITDVVLPGCSGSDLAERVNEIMPETKVLYVSGYSEDSMIPPLAPGPAQAFLKKPFTRDDFLVKVRQLLGSC